MVTSMDANVKFSLVDTNGIRLRVAESGTGPLIVLVHGWPESWYSWRHQIPALASAGYRVAAIDVRGQTVLGTAQRFRLGEKRG